jgi:hypothetical protein
MQVGKTFYDNFPYCPIWAVSVRRLLTRVGNLAMVSPYSTQTYYGASPAMIQTPWSSDPGYAASDGVTSISWKDQTGNGRHLTTTDTHAGCVVTQGMSQGPALITGVGTSPGFFMGNSNSCTNPLSGDFTFICLMRASANGPIVTGLTYRTAGTSGTLLDARVGTGTSDICIGINGNVLYAATGNTGSGDTFLSGTTPVVNSLLADPKLIVVTRSQGNGNINIRVNRADDNSDTLSTGSFSSAATIKMYPNAFVAEMMLFNQAIPLGYTQQIETEIAGYYGLP